MGEDLGVVMLVVKLRKEPLELGRKGISRFSHQSAACSAKLARTNRFTLSAASSSTRSSNVRDGTLDVFKDTLLRYNYVRSGCLLTPT